MQEVTQVEIPARVVLVVVVIAATLNLTDQTPVQPKIGALGKRQRMNTAYEKPKTALSQPSVAPLQAGLREASWLRKEVRASPATEAVACILDCGPAEPVTYTMGTEGEKVHIWKGGVRKKKGNTVLWQMEQDKALQWRYREQMTWQELSDRAKAQSKAATEAEERGFQMWAWDILDRVRTLGKFTAIIGPTSLETCPTFEKWCPWGELNANLLQQEDITLVLLDAVPQEWQVHVMEEASHTTAWAVVSRSTLLH
eukprot:1552076-Rhodomonas_salina.1